jgi:hypothetical protein
MYPGDAYRRRAAMARPSTKPQVRDADDRRVVVSDPSITGGQDDADARRDEVGNASAKGAPKRRRWASRYSGEPARVPASRCGEETRPRT